VFHTIRLPLTQGQFRKLPRNAAYKYEYLGDEAWLTPRPKWFHAVLDLGAAAAPGAADLRQGVRLRRLGPDDWDDLPGLFAASFHRVQPFGSLDDEARNEAPRRALRQTRDGG